MIFLSFFKTLVGKEVAVELKNDVVMTGILHSVDQYLNVKLLNVQVVEPQKYPQLIALSNCFIRGSVVRYIQIPPQHVDVQLLQDAARQENAPASAAATTSKA
uniref:U6 snRNA-associated Sm-like protein LSm2 n=1 Tax=Entomoneis paludosa TaxID=265537 RepID=A0A7S3DW81_9STRA